MKIDCGNCTLRRWQYFDAERLANILNNPKVHSNLRDIIPNPYTKQDGLEWIKLNQVKSPQNLVIAHNNELIGAIGLKMKEDVYRISAEIGYYLDEGFWGKGIMTSAVNGMIGYAFSTFDVNRIYAGIFSWNPASIRVLEKCGFTLEGTMRQSIIKKGQILDEHIYSILKDEYHDENHP